MLTAEQRMCPLSGAQSLRALLKRGELDRDVDRQSTVSLGEFGARLQRGS